MQSSHEHSPGRSSHGLRAGGLAILCVVFSVEPSMGGGKVALYGIRMAPYGISARQYSAPGWGLGADGAFPLPGGSEIISGAAGLEWVNLLSRTNEYYDPASGLRVEQQTDQNFYRLYAGAQAGGFGRGFLRPYAAAHLALTEYAIATDVVIPDDGDAEAEIRQRLRRETRLTFGYDLCVGIDLNVSSKFSILGGIRYVKSISVPQQLGEGSVRIHPQYLQVNIGFAIPMDALDETNEEEGDHE